MDLHYESILYYRLNEFKERMREEGADTKHIEDIAKLTNLFSVDFFGFAPRPSPVPAPDLEKKKLSAHLIDEKDEVRSKLAAIGEMCANLRGIAKIEEMEAIDIDDVGDVVENVNPDASLMSSYGEEEPGFPNYVFWKEGSGGREALIWRDVWVECSSLNSLNE